ncbi:tryptophan synthase beta subunit-like PLP-dependent enzyme [Lactarius quietus]|nr:tryptophan synthase beta subunit-like PLP-dependent enzyme [Lactarius quietus]
MNKSCPREAKSELQSASRETEELRVCPPPQAIRSREIRPAVNSVTNHLPSLDTTTIPFTFHPKSTSQFEMERSQIVMNSVLDAVGNTPLIRLDRIAKQEGLRCNLLGKLEYISAGGSVKDRIAKRMIEIAEQEGRLIPGQSVVIEPTSGNTGIGLAMACAVKEKEAALRALGAEVIRTPDEVSSDSPESHIGVARRLQKEIPGGVILDQYTNLNNPLAHELTTAPEIMRLCLRRGAGTGGTITGVARGIKKAHNKDCIVVGVDPVGSVIAVPASLNEAGKGVPYAVEGLGYDFTPEVITREPGMINTWLKSNDKDSFAAVQLIMRHEGMLVGGSCGSAVAGALEWLRLRTPGKNVVILLPDGLRNYIGKDWFLDMALKQEPSPLAQRIAEILDKPAN